MTENENLVKSGILDTLAVKNQELAEIKRAEDEKAIIAKKKLRDKKLVKLFLWDNFPLVAPEDIPEIPEKEFPLILKRAKKYYLAKIRTASAIALLPIGGTLASFIIFLTTLVNIPPIGSPQSVKVISLLCVVGGLAATCLLSWLSCFSIAKIRKWVKILIKGGEK